MTDIAKRVGNELLVNVEGAGDQFAPAIARLASGGFVVTWITTHPAQDGDGRAIKAQVFNAAGSKVGGELLVNAQSVGDQNSPAVAGLNNGGFVISWWTADTAQDGNGTAIKAQRFSAAGVKVGSEFGVNSEEAGNQTFSSIAALANGGFVVTWSSSDETQDGSSWAIKAQIYNAAGTKVGGEFLVNTQGEGEQGGSTVTGLAAGGFVVTWISHDAMQDGSGQAIKAQVFNAAGGKVGSEFLVNGEGEAHQDLPEVTGLTGGGFVITWGTSDAAQDGDGDAIKGQVFNAAGVKVGGEFLVNTRVAGNQADPDIAALVGGGFVITWEANNSDNDGDGFAVMAQIFDASGTKSGSEFIVNALGHGGQFDPTVAGLTDGGFVISWDSSDASQDDDGFAIKAQIFELTEPEPVDFEPADFARIGGEILVNAEQANDQSLPAIAGLAGGGFVTTWTTSDPEQDGDGWAIKGQLFDAAGAKAGEEFLVNNEAAGNQDDAAVIGLENGGFVVSWSSWDAEQDGSLTAIKAQVFDADGDKVGDELLINTNGTDHQAYPTIAALGNGGFVVAWTTWDATQDDSGRAIKAQVFDAAGEMIGGEFLVNTDAAGDQDGATVTGLVNGGFVVSWHSGDVMQDGSNFAIKAQVFSAAGAKVGGEFQVNSEGVDDQGYPAVTALANGGFVISWDTYDTLQDGSGAAIKAQVFNADGGKVGNELLVNTEGAGDQVRSTIAGLADGGFVVSWETGDPAQDGDGFAIKAQAFDATGGRLGAEFLVNMAGANNQVAPAIAGLADGGFVIGWTTGDPNVDGDAQIKAQVFGVQTTPNALPEALDDDATTAADTAIVIEVLTNDSDGDDDALEIVSVANPTNGTAVINVDGTITYTPDGGFTGTDNFEYTISDGNGGAATATVTVAVTSGPTPNSVPVAADNGATTGAGAAVVIDVLTNDSDDDDDALSIVSVTNPANGSAVINGDGTITYTPDRGFDGTDTFEYTVSDGNGGTDTATVIVEVSGGTISNSGPVAVNDSTTTGSGVAVVIDVLANDGDEDDDALEIVSLANPANGSAVINDDGTITYTPDSGFTGTDSFDYTVSDGNGGTDTASVAVQVSGVNRAPSLDAIAPLTTLTGTAIVLTAEASDPDGDSLTFTTGTPTHGQATVEPNGRIVYTPGAGFTGDDSFAVNVSDGRGGTASTTVQVSIVSPDNGRDWQFKAGSGLAAEIGGTGLVFGTNGFEDISVLDLPGKVAFDPSFNRGGDLVRLNGAASAWHAALTGSSALFSDGDTVVVIPIGVNGTTIAFDDGGRVLRYDSEASTPLIGTQAIGSALAPVVSAGSDNPLPELSDPDAVGRLFLAPDALATVGGDITVFGTAGDEDVHAISGSVILDPSFNRGGDVLVLDAITSSFSARLSGSNVLLDGEQVNVLIPVGTVGLTIGFSDGERVLRYDQEQGVVLIDTIQIATAPVPLTDFA